MAEKKPLGQATEFPLLLRVRVPSGSDAALQTCAPSVSITTAKKYVQKLFGDMVRSSSADGVRGLTVHGGDFEGDKGASQWTVSGFCLVSIWILSELVIHLAPGEHAPFVPAGSGPLSGSGITHKGREVGERLWQLGF